MCFALCATLFYFLLILGAKCMPKKFFCFYVTICHVILSRYSKKIITFAGKIYIITK